MDLRAKWDKIKPILTDERVMAGLWVFIGIISAITKISPDRHNNFFIFRGVFWHVWQQLPLYAEYPAEYFDINHYGPLFSLIIAPFAILPDWLGLIFWNTCLALFLYWSIRQLGLTRYQHVFMLWYCGHELLTALFMQQFNVAIAAIILLSYAFVKKEKDVWATLMIVIGTLVKLYGIVGLAFFFFSKHKGKYVLWLIVWSIVLFIAPMLISSPEYIVGQYLAWIDCLAGKNTSNLLSAMQNVSLLGIIRKTGYAITMGMDNYWQVLNLQSLPTPCIWSTYSDLWVIIPGLVLFFIPYLRTSQYANRSFQLTILASVLMFVCLFSTGTESSGYITALLGVVLWYAAAPWQRSKWDLGLMIFAFILTSMSPSDLFPAYIRYNWVHPFALKALPVAIIWLQLCVELMTKNYEDSL